MAIKETDNPAIIHNVAVIQSPPAQLGASITDQMLRGQGTLSE